MGHLRKANVEQFISNNASGWGSHEMSIRICWGYWQPLEVTVVTMFLHQGSDLGFQRQTAGSGTYGPVWIQTRSPPLGIPIPDMARLESAFGAYIRNITLTNLESYTDVAYDYQESELPELLLKSVCSWYTDGVSHYEEVSYIISILKRLVVTFCAV